MSVSLNESAGIRQENYKLCDVVLNLQSSAPFLTYK